MQVSILEEPFSPPDLSVAGRCVYDMGIATGTANVHRDRALLRAHASGRIGDRLVFHRFLPTACIGNHQTKEREIRVKYCSEVGIGVVRRPTAGGALYLDPGQQCFSLVVPEDTLGKTVAERLKAGAGILSAGLRRLGVPTTFKAPNDLQIEGRQKIASVFLAEMDGSALLFASLIVELDLRSAMQALLVPTEKLTVTGLEHAKERMTSLAEILGHVPSEQVVQAALTVAAEECLGFKFSTGDSEWSETADEVVDLQEIDGWDLDGNRFETKDKVEGATLRILLEIAQGGLVSFARFATDGHFAPADALEELAQYLHGARSDHLVSRCQSWFEIRPIDAAGFVAGDIVRLVERAASKWELQNSLGLTHAQTTGLMLAGEGRDSAKVLEQASVMLVPYCAKPNWCKWRHTIDCVECGKCEVGDAYIMARERNMEVITITNFEHLAETLGKMKEVGVQSYVGMCCGEFFLKRHHAFRDSGMDAVLLDIEGATCYELKEEHLAYAGAFKAEAVLDLDAVKKVMSKVPVRPLAQRPCITGIARRPGEKRHEAGGGCGSCSCGKSASKPLES